MRVWWKKSLYVVVGFAVLWLGIRYLLPILLPFLLGLLVALAAEPVVNLGVRRLHLRRGVVSVVAVTLTLTALVAILSLVGAAAIKEIGTLTTYVPNLTEGVETLQGWLTAMAENAPEQVRPLVQRTVRSFFDDGTTWVQQLSGRLPGILTGVISGVGSSAIGVGTGILASFLISARLPHLRITLRSNLPESWYTVYQPALKRFQSGLLGWLKAQGKLSLITWGIVSVGFFVLRIPYAPGWAALVAVVDAVPILGTGTVLIPFALISLLQGNSLQATGLLCTYGAATITRTTLEPRLVGRQLGLDPLITLFSLYIGYRFWGFWGLLLAPIFASGAKNLFSSKETPN